MAVLWTPLRHQHSFEITDEEYHEFRLELKRVNEANKHINQDNFEDVDEPDLMDDDPNIPLQRREDQGRGDPEFKGTVESLGRENKHIILETEGDALIECSIKWLNMYNKTVQQKIMERVVKQETKAEEEEEVEKEQEEPKEPTVPPPTKVSMECQTDDSFLSDPKAGSSYQKEEPTHVKAPQRQRYQRSRKQIFKKMTRLQNLNRPKDFTMVPISLEMRMIQFFESFPHVFLMVTMVNGQGSTIKVMQLQLNTDMCSGMLSTERLQDLTKIIGILTQMTN